MPRATILALCLIFLQLALPAVSAAGPAPDIDTRETTSIGPNRSIDRATATFRSLLLGVYDPHDQLQDSDRSRIEHVFVYWQAVDEPMLTAKMRFAEMKGRTLMVTVEPYTKAANWRDGGDHLFADIMSGRFDRQIAAVCSAVASYQGGYWIRWGHEMEQPTDRYPWARGDAHGYIAAYRYFVDACRTIAPRAQFVWSPKGERELAAYYPGDDYVDLIGVSVWGLEKWDRERYGKPRGFAKTFDQKYRRVEKFGKPIIVAELGVAGRKAYRQNWMSEISALPAGSSPFPLLAGIVYFNDKEPYHWPGGYGSPDWRMTASDLGL
ncbi:glycosyl hydrolase [Mesorhizobium sp. M00.F.Ca.ET.216.01.1.1]|uniref:glycoside hydrolase family 26 protein n=1 Tax=Mesorhizobium sp. M00.F.Ca.ET.216.01.1.1 TaxID=2500528 RepID=UPI000FDC2145|nr:glycosyl hydrolase [Mesorhizobium sp. M00.F.Ca.ET.216.01.1.1]TGQ38323.1 beta-mannosidase [Mesorhizobium sp. M00.F.Ca.ET.216.01.1.1]TJW47334.1 MAG: beta-mannosidase [Mesorhizobium sp.]